MSEWSLQNTAALTVFFVGLLSWVLIIYLNYRLSRWVSSLVKDKTALVYLFTGVFSLVSAGACALGAAGSALISSYSIKSALR